jgi:RHS repeat-associated protein
LYFTYDYQGRLVKKEDGSQIEVYAYDGWNRIASFEQTTSLTLQKTFLWGLDLSGSLQGAGGVGGLLKEGDLYPAYDANGNIMQKLDATGEVVMSVAYDAFGQLTSGQLVGEYGFSSKPRITGINWYYYGFRYYDPMTGRWPSRDPIGEEGFINNILYKMLLLEVRSLESVLSSLIKNQQYSGMITFIEQLISLRMKLVDSPLNRHALGVNAGLSNYFFVNNDPINKLDYNGLWVPQAIALALAAAFVANCTYANYQTCDKQCAPNGVKKSEQTTAGIKFEDWGIDISMACGWECECDCN